MDLITGVVFLLFGILIYFIPFIVASNREHPQTGAIFVLNLFAGWTFVGWLIALVWACTNQD